MFGFTEFGSQVRKLHLFQPSTVGRFRGLYALHLLCDGGDCRRSKRKSEYSLGVTVTTDDQTAPLWSGNAALLVRNVSGDSATIIGSPSK